MLELSAGTGKLQAKMQLHDKQDIWHLTEACLLDIIGYIVLIKKKNITCIYIALMWHSTVIM